MPKTERELVETARDALRKSEAEWRKAIAAVMGVVKVNADNGEAKLSNAAFWTAGDLTEELANMMRCHARATSSLLENWPDWAADVTVKGPGR